MPSNVTHYEFGAFRLEPRERRLSRDGDPIAIPPKAFDLLVMLVEEPDRLLRKEHLIERLWPGVFVEEVNLAQNISTIRRALGGDGREAFIQTVAGSGYRFVASVRAVSAQTPAVAPPSGERSGGARSRLLVLPFRMLKPDADVEFLAFGLPDALTATLSGLESVVVRSSLVAARFAGGAPDLPIIAREAGVDFVVSGTLLRAGDQLRVVAQLADAAAGTLIWSCTEQASVDDLFRLQDSLVERIAGSLARPLTERDHRQLRRDVPATPKAYEYYLRANEAGRPAAQDGGLWTVARDLYLQSIDEDPGYAPAWTRLARVYRLLGKYRTEDAGANLARAEDALNRALTLNPDLSIAHNLYAHIDIDRGRAADAMVRLLERARDRGGDADIFAGLVQACRFCGLLDASVAAHAHALQCDPTLATSVMHTFFVMRRYDEVVTSAGALKGYVFAMSLAGLGREAEALTLLGQLEQQAHRLPPELLAAARAFIEGKREACIAALDMMEARPPDAEAHYYHSRQFAALGEGAKTLNALTRAIDGGYHCYESLAADPWFDAIRDEPGFQRLLARAREGRQAAASAFRAAGGPGILHVDPLP